MQRTFVVVVGMGCLQKKCPQAEVGLVSADEFRAKHGCPVDKERDTDQK